MAVACGPGDVSLRDGPAAERPWNRRSRERAGDRALRLPDEPVVLPGRTRAVEPLKRLTRPEVPLPVAIEGATLAARRLVRDIAPPVHLEAPAEPLLHAVHHP